MPTKFESPCIRGKATLPQARMKPFVRKQYQVPGEGQDWASGTPELKCRVDHHAGQVSPPRCLAQKLLAESNVLRCKAVVCIQQMLVVRKNNNNLSPASVIGPQFFL